MGIPRGDAKITQEQSYVTTTHARLIILSASNTADQVTVASTLRGPKEHGPNPEGVC